MLQGQHYIPQYYLRGFSDPAKTAHIWVYEKGAGQAFCSTIRKAARENNRWPPETEQYFSETIEGPANPILEKIRKQKQLTQEDKRLLTRYMVIMLQRTDDGFQQAKQTLPEVKDQVFSKVENEILANNNLDPENKELWLNRIKEISNSELEKDEEFVRKIWHLMLNSESFPMVLQMLPIMRWTFLVTTKIQPFLTCDNPIFYFKELGIGNIRSEMLFPVSSYIMLFIHRRQDLNEGYLQIDDSIAKEINRRMVSIATKYVYYCQNEPWVVRLIRNKSITIKQGALQTISN